MPGYERERDRLKEHLGIEWIPNGLDKSNFAATKPIRHDYDLNCDFSDPSKCHWKNMDEGSGLDSLDFHLFEKTDFTEFPALRVGPGPTKVPEGEKMIFTGDKRRDEQHAIFYSSPIGCQNTTGNLTFTYWVYNSARVEVILLEDSADGYKVVYEKPYVDCGTLQINTECHAIIPPRLTPFRIGIRAYDMATPEGSFVMIDNILYSTSLCNVAIDLGDEFQSFSLETSAEGKPISAASQLGCDNFDQRCRWRSSARGPKSWKRSTSTLPREFLYNTTGNDIGPDGRYAILYIEQDTKEKLDYLRSDPISCQSQTENALSFRFWKTKEIELEVCAIDVNTGKDMECKDVPSAMSPAPVKISFQSAAKNFMLVIRIKTFNSDFDGAVIIDDIEYTATLCTDALSVFDLGEHFLSTPMLSLLLNRHIHSAKELACDFSRRAADCVWGPADSTDAPDVDSEIAGNVWSVGHGPLNHEKFFSLTGSSELPEGEFAVARLETGGSALLLSEVIRCVLDTASIQFNMWITGSASLQVCLVDEASPSLLDCQPAKPGPVVVDLPAIKRPFRIALRAEAPDQGIVIVDNIDVQGEVCPSVVRQFSAKSYRPQAADVPDPNVCRLLSCDFSRGYPCLYESSNIANGALHHVVKHRLVASLNKAHNVAILESVSFHLNTVSRLHFEYLIEGDVTLFVCNDSAKKELENCYKVEDKNGKDYIELLPSDTKIYLIARLTEKGSKGTFTIDKLHLTDTSDNNAC
ncbi:unnamed protein product [Auanema sp. JU1783]|nr:unnamed protein product [Auanema sp. JU1783]